MAGDWLASYSYLAAESKELTHDPSNIHNMATYTTSLMSLVQSGRKLKFNPVPTSHAKCAKWASLSWSGVSMVDRKTLKQEEEKIALRGFKLTSSFARFSYSECGLRSLRSLTHMRVMSSLGSATPSVVCARSHARDEFARCSYSECGLRSIRSLTHMGVMRQGGNVTFL